MGNDACKHGSARSRGERLRSGYVSGRASTPCTSVASCRLHLLALAQRTTARRDATPFSVGSSFDSVADFAPTLSSRATA
jgi:hypothetical protein